MQPKTTIKAGEMRYQLTIQSPSATRGTLGQTEWETFATVRAKLEPVVGARGGKELAKPNLTGAEAYMTFTIRYLAGVKATMRVLVSGFAAERIFVITHTLEDPMRRYVEITCREVTTR